jgi:hypothetical protein
MKDMKKVSRWIKIQTKQITPRHRLWGYAEENDGWVSYIHYQNQDIAMDEFLYRDNPWARLPDDYPSYITAYRVVGYDDALFLEFSEDEESVRLWREV